MDAPARDDFDHTDLTQAAEKPPYVSPYLLRPLRSLAEVREAMRRAAERDALLAADFLRRERDRAQALRNPLSRPKANRVKAGRPLPSALTA